MKKIKIRTQQTSLGKVPLCLVAIWCRNALYKKIQHLSYAEKQKELMAFTNGFYEYNNLQNN